VSSGRSLGQLCAAAAAAAPTAAGALWTLQQSNFSPHSCTHNTPTAHIQEEGTRTHIRTRSEMRTGRSMQKTRIACGLAGSPTLERASPIPQEVPVGASTTVPLCVWCALRVSSRRLVASMLLHWLSCKMYIQDVHPRTLRPNGRPHSSALIDTSPRLMLEPVQIPLPSGASVVCFPSLCVVSTREA